MKRQHSTGGKKVKDYGSRGGLRRHRTSGVAHNHANSIARTREYNREQEKLAAEKQKTKPKMYSNVKDVFSQR